MTEDEETVAELTEGAKAILDVVGIVSDRHGEARAVWLLLVAAGYAAQAVGVDAREASAAQRVLRKRIDKAVLAIGSDNATVSAVMGELLRG